MIHEEDELEFDPNYNNEISHTQFHQQLMLVDEDDEDCTQEETDLYQQLAEKDHYLLLAAEAGKHLLEKNQELSGQYQDLQTEYAHKIELLEQERHHLRRELTDRENLYESRMQDLQHELSSLSGELRTVQKSSKSFELSNKSTYNDLTYQNHSLVKELDEVKVYNQELAQQVQTLSKRIEGRLAQQPQADHQRNTSYDETDGEQNSHEDKEIPLMELKTLKEQVQKLSDHKQLLEGSLVELAHEKAAITFDQKQTVGKVSTLEEELLGLKQQISMCQEDLDKTKRKNTQLKDQLEEYVMLQQSGHHGSGINANNSLFNELEMSLSEADMNLRHMNSTPNKTPRLDHDDNDDDGDILQTTTQAPTSKDQSIDDEQLRSELITLYRKVHRLLQQLTDSHANFDEDLTDIQTIDITMVTKMVDQVVVLINERVLSLGAIDARSNSPQLDMDNDDTLSQPDSHTSDNEMDLYETQIQELNQRLSIATSSLETAKRDLTKAQAVATEHEEKSLTLSVKVNSQEREIDALRKERDIMLSDTSMEEKLRQALEERDQALQRENQMKSQYETVQNDMQKLNNQLISAVQHKLELSEQLEQWQFDMASLIDQQLATKIKKDQKRSRKRSSNTTSGNSTTNPARMFAAKFFASRNNSRVSSPTVKSPVPPKT